MENSLQGHREASKTLIKAGGTIHTGVQVTCLDQVVVVEVVSTGWVMCIFDNGLIELADRSDTVQSHLFNFPFVSLAREDISEKILLQEISEISLPTFF